MNTLNPSLGVSFGAYTPRIIALTLMALLLVLALTGCTNPSQASPKINPAGVYALVSVDGQKVPCSVTHQATVLKIKSGVFTIKADGSCSSLMNFSLPGREGVKREVKATYTQQGAQLTMRWAGAGTTIGRVQGNQFTMNNEGMFLLYKK